MNYDWIPPSKSFLNRVSCKALLRELLISICVALIAISVTAQTLVVDAPTADAGTVHRGVAITKVFIVRNTGSAALLIKDVRPACGCMHAEFDRTIPPRGEGKITLTVDTKSFSSAISKSAVVLSNDPATPELSLIVVANVKGFVNALPSGSFSFQGNVPTLRIQMTKGQPGVAEVTLASEHPAFKPTDATTKQFLSGGKSYLRATLAPDQESARWKLILTSDPTTPAGPLYGEVAVKTGIPEEPEFRIQVTGVVMLPGETTGRATSERAAEPALTNDEILKLVAADLGDEIVVAKIKNASVVRLDVSTDTLLSLKEHKVSKAVIAAMIERAGEQNRAVPTAPAAPRDPSIVPKPNATPPSPCEGVELLGLHKEDFRPMSPLILYFAKVRNGTSMTKIVSVEWTNLYGERIRNTAEVGAGQIATLQLAAQQPIERLPIDLRLGTCR